MMIWIMGSLSEWGLFFDIRSFVMILEVGFEVLVTMFTVFEDVLSYAGLLMLDLELSCSLFGCPGWVIRWVLCDCVC